MAIYYTISSRKKPKVEFLISLRKNITDKILTKLLIDSYSLNCFFCAGIENIPLKIIKKAPKYIPLSKRQDKPDSALWLIKQHPILKDSQIAKLVGITKNSVSSIRNKSYWNFNNLNPKDPVAMGLFSQKELVEAIEKAERRIKKEKKEKEKAELAAQ